MTDNKRDDSGPAFPHPDCDHHPGDRGMSLRDYFAAHAPPMPDSWVGIRDERLVATWRWVYADAMLAERTRRP